MAGIETPTAPPGERRRTDRRRASADRRRQPTADRAAVTALRRACRPIGRDPHPRLAHLVHPHD
jgi:hypothetical protein